MTQEKKLTLYSISAELRNIGHMIETSGGEITDENAEILEKLQGELKFKTDGVIDWIKSLSNHVTEIDTRIKELQSLKKTKQNELNAFKGYVVMSMKLLEEPKVEGRFGFITLRKGTEKVEVVDENKIPIEFLKTKTTTSIDLAGIGRCLKADASKIIPGVNRVMGEPSLLIK